MRYLNKLLLTITTATLLTVNTVQAQNLSAYYQVIELEGDDHLNVRAEPSSASEDIGAVSYTHLTLPTTPYV